MTSTHYRLPRLVQPVDYDIALRASPKRATFSGTLVYTAKVLQPTSVVELHARDLKVSEVMARSGSTELPAKVVRFTDRETVELRFASPLKRGKWQVQLQFSGKLNPSMHGLYLAKDGPERALVTQCEATDARAIFPCCDEPDMKATLCWTVRTDAGLQVITNGVPESSRKVRGTAEVDHKFARTRIISTYLAALTIGKLESSKVQRIAGIDSRIWAGVGKKNQTAFAQEVTAQVLPWYQKYFGHKYNYQKLDQVAVPGFDAGAMENVGAIFYRQNLLLMQPGATSWAAQKRIAEVIAHEIAHQWFGNLVTMKWWDDLWLNEAFATWVAYKACDVWHPEWRIWDDYLEGKESALAADALVNTHPIYTEVKSPAQATELFDVITYEKGCAVLRMAENYLSPPVFAKGIASYIKTYKNSNAAGADLWNKLGEAASEPVADLMRSWVNQPGFPLLTVTSKPERDRTVLHIGQRRFFTHAANMQQEEEAPQSWMIPMVIQYDLGNGPKEFRALLEEREGAIPLPEGGKARWVYPNAGSTGFYRLMLDDATLRALLEHGLDSLAPSARMSLLEDQWALVRCGLSNVEQFMDVLTAFRGEHDHAVVRTMVARLESLYEVLCPEADQPRLATYARWLFAGQIEELGWEAEPEEPAPRAVRRAWVIDVLGTVGRDPEVLREAARQVGLEMDDPSAVEPNLAGIVTALAALEGDKKRLDSYVRTYLARKKNGSSPELQARYLSALTCFEKPDMAKKVLALCLDGTIPQEQLRAVLTPLLRRRATQQVTWTFLKKNWSTLGPKVGSMGVSRLVESTGALPLAQQKDVQQFFTKNPVEEAKRALQKALEAMQLRHELVSREAPRLADWLKNARYQALAG